MQQVMDSEAYKFEFWKQDFRFMARNAEEDLIIDVVAVAVIT